MFVIGTAGHVDHGKSLLVQTLTGIDPDRLDEEKVRGMTIDLGFAWLTLPSGRVVSIVDVPGHERFIKNMLAGSGGIDLALLVVAADDGVMPQTREHLAILDLLGVSAGVVALTKSDLVEADWLALVAADIRGLLAGTTLAGVPVVACSSITRVGFDELTSRLDAAIDALPPKQPSGSPRLPIDRVFTMTGFGTVVTGTLIEGAIAVGDELEAVPGGIRARVRGLQSHQQSVERALPGTRTAVNLGRVERADLRRGLVLAPPGALRPTSAIDVRLQAVPSLPHPLRHNIMLTFHCGADEATTQLRLLDTNELSAGDEAWAQLKLATQVAVKAGDRFVLRTPNDTVGGGVVVDVAPRRHRRRDPRTIERLNRRLNGTPADLVRAAIEASPFGDRANLVEASRLTSAEVDHALAHLAESIVALANDGDTRYLERARERGLHANTTTMLGMFHDAHPLRRGMPIEELRSRLRLEPEQLGLLIASWDNVRIEGADVALASFKPCPTAEQQSDIDAYMAALRQHGSSPPQFALESDVLSYLVETGHVVDAGAGIIFDADMFARMTDAVRAYLQEHGTASLAQTRDLLGTNRKLAQALLEHMDRMRITRRVGDERVLR